MNNCYSIELVPEIDIRKVLLFPHKAVKTALVDQQLLSPSNVTDPVFLKQVRDDIILFKHRIFHALGLNHKYMSQSIMNAYTNPWQEALLFYILKNDFDAMLNCYMKTGVSSYVKEYNSRNVINNMHLLNFVSDFDKFKRYYQNEGSIL